MKLLLSLFCLFIMRYSAIADCDYKNYLNQSHLQIDFFMYHYKKLDSIINTNPYDTSKARIYSVQYMERTTNIKAHPDGDYFGWIAFTRNDLFAWKKWYDKNRSNKQVSQKTHLRL